MFKNLNKSRFKINRTSLGLALFGLLCFYVFSCDSGATEKVQLLQQHRKVSLVAHRGASDIAPENTLAAIRKALDSPADFIEIDIHQTKDGELVLMHDASLNRTTNGKGAIAEYSLAEIKKLDAGLWFDSTFQNERVPTLEEVLKLVKGRKKLLIEIKKADDNFYSGIEAKTLELIRQHRAQQWCVIQSFYDDVLEKIWANEFAVVTHKLIIGKVPFLPLYFDHRPRWGSFEKFDRAAAINPHRYFATRSLVKHLHNRGFKTFVWTVDNPQTINSLLAMGVDGVLTNKVSNLTIE